MAFITAIPVAASTSAVIPLRCVPRSRGGAVVAARRRALRCCMPVQQTEAVDTNPVQDEFSITKTVLPLDTDYSNAMWHGNYIKWLEEARVDYLNYRGLPYKDLVSVHDTELPVRELSVRYHTPARFGDEVSVTVRLGEPVNKVRLVIESTFRRVCDGTLIASASVTVVPVSATTGKLRRAWPDALAKALLG